MDANINVNAKSKRSYVYMRLKSTIASIIINKSND